MGEIILNEREWITDALNNLTLGKKPSETIGRLAKFYYQTGHKKSDITGLLEDFLIRCNPRANLVYWRQYIDECVARCDQRGLIEIPYIPVTKNELDYISAIKNKKPARVLFAFLCLAKYGNAVNPKNNSWVSRERREIFSLANVTMTTHQQRTVINEFHTAGHITSNRIVDNANFRVSFVDNDSEPIMRITDFRNLGNQYAMATGDHYLLCQCCGLCVKKTNNKQRYCRKCAVGVNNGVITPPHIAA